jgi:aspartate racemase
MRTIGLIGGMSWESSEEYYRLINRLVRGQLGGNANDQSLMVTVNFAEIEAWQHQHDRVRLADEMARAAGQLQAGGADCVLLCTNTMTVGLLGTRFTMEDGFYQDHTLLCTPAFGAGAGSGG